MYLIKLCCVYMWQNRNIIVLVMIHVIMWSYSTLNIDLPMSCLRCLRCHVVSHGISVLSYGCTHRIIFLFTHRHWIKEKSIMEIMDNLCLFNYITIGTYWISDAIVKEVSCAYGVIPQRAKFMGPTWGPWAPCWPHEPCYLGRFKLVLPWCVK